MRTTRVSLPPFSTFIFDIGDRDDRSASGSVDSEVDELADDPGCASTPAHTMVSSPSPPPQSAIPRTPSEGSFQSCVPYPPWVTEPRRSSTYSVQSSPEHTDCAYSRQSSIAPEFQSNPHEPIIPTERERRRELRRRNAAYTEYTSSRQSSTAPSPRPSAREESLPVPAGLSQRAARSGSPSPESEDNARETREPAAAPRPRTSTPVRRFLAAYPPQTPSWDSDATTAREPTYSPLEVPKTRRRDTAPVREEKADRARAYRKRAKDAQLALDRVLPESKRVKPGESYILTMDHAREHIHELNRAIAELNGRVKYFERAAQDAADEGEESEDEKNVYEGDICEDDVHAAKRSRLA